MTGQYGLCQADQGLGIGDRIGGEHTGPDEAVGLYGIGRVANPPEEVFAGAPNSRAVPSRHERPDVRVPEPGAIWLLLDEPPIVCGGQFALAATGQVLG